MIPETGQILSQRAQHNAISIMVYCSVICKQLRSCIHLIVAMGQPYYSTASSNNAVKTPQRSIKKKIPRLEKTVFFLFSWSCNGTEERRVERRIFFLLQCSDCRKYKMPLCRLMCQNVDNALIKLLSHSNTLERRFYMTADKDREQM